MTQVAAGITISLDGFYTAPDDRPGQGLGEGGERLHDWVFGGPWTYGNPAGKPLPEDAAWLSAAVSRTGAVVGGRGTYDSADAWGGQNPWNLPFFIVTHRVDEEPAGGAFKFVDGVEAAIREARAAAAGKDVHLMGGGQVIRQAMEAGLVDELTLIVAPIVLGGGKNLFQDFPRSLYLEPMGVRHSRLATFLDYRVGRPGRTPRSA